MNPKLLSASALAAFVLSAPAMAEEGMWTFDAFPAAKVKAAYGTAPDQKWLDRVRLNAIRLTGGCSASIVSSQALVLTNHHCVRDCAQANSTGSVDYARDGFVAAALTDERKCPGQQAEIVTSISDVTARVLGAIGTASGQALARARGAETAAIEKENCRDAATERCQVVTLFGGGQYKLYKYRKYSDVRLVYAPESDAAFFGGDPDNFNFPRYDLDAAFLRLYENGKPIATPNHLTWAGRAPKDGELVYVVGNPGATQRLYTQAQMAFLRDVGQQGTEIYLSELRGRIIGAMGTDAERIRTGNELLFGVENSYKARFGQWQSLLDPAFSGKLAAAEADLRAKVNADAALKAKIGDPWADVAKSQETYRDIYKRFVFLEGRAGFGSELYSYAVELVRAANQKALPSAERLPEYADSNLPLLEKQLTDERPTYPWLEELTIVYWLSKTREALTTDAPEVKTLLGRESPEQIGQRVVAGTKLADPKVRKALFDGGIEAIRASSDPLIQLAMRADPAAMAIRNRYRFEVEAPVLAAQARLAQARFAAYGTDLYPDATFTLRITYGAVKGWTYQGQTIPTTTYFSGLSERATGADPFKLPAKMAAAVSKLDGSKAFNFVATTDIIGGNSGSPILAADGSVIGAAFDGNIHSLGGAYGFDPALNRTVGVSTVAVEEALAKIYPAPRLLAELKAK